MVDAKYEIEIKTKADLAAAKESTRALGEAIKETKALGKDASELEAHLEKLNVALAGESARLLGLASALEKSVGAMRAMKADTSLLDAQLAAVKAKLATHANVSWVDDLRGGLRDVASELPGLSKGLDLVDKFGSGPVGQVAVAIAGVVAALGAAKAAVGEFSKTEGNIARLDQALAQNGLLTDRTRQGYQELAKDLQNLTAVSDEHWLSVIRQLTQQGSTEATMRRDIDAVQALTGIYGNAEQAASAWGKALHGQFDILREHGIIVDKNATTAEKLDQAYRELVRRGGGQLEASAKTLGGQFDNLGNQFSDFMSAIGGSISSTGALQGVLGVLSGTFEGLAITLGGTVPRMDGMKNAMAQMAPTLAQTEGAARSYADALHEIKSASDLATSALDRQTEAAKRLQHLQDEQTDAKMALDLAKVDALQKAGKISSVDASNRKFDIRQNAAAEKFRRDQETAANEAKALKGQNESAYVGPQALNDLAEEQETAVKRDAEIRKRHQKLERENNRRVAEAEASVPALDTDRYGKTGVTFDRANAERNALVAQARQAAEDQNRFSIEKFNKDPANKLSGVSEDDAKKAREEANKSWAENYKKNEEREAKIEALRMEANSRAMAARTRGIADRVTHNAATGTGPQSDEELGREWDRLTNPPTRHGPPGRTSENRGVTDRGWDNWVPRDQGPRAPMFPQSDEQSERPAPVPERRQHSQELLRAHQDAAAALHEQHEATVTVLLALQRQAQEQSLALRQLESRQLNAR